MVSELTRFQQAGHIKLEDTIFIYNARDVPMCTIGACVLDVGARWSYRQGVGRGTSGSAGKALWVGARRHVWKHTAVSCACGACPCARRVVP